MTSRHAFSLAAAALLAACGGSDTSPAAAPPQNPGGGGTGQITLRGAGPFGPHTGQTLRAALVRVADGATLDVQKAVVAAGDPAFAFTFAPAVDLSAAYQVRYWADANSNDACDPPPTDHQWQVAVPAGASLVAVSHNASFTNVCDTFTFPLTFRGNATFDGPHAGNAYQAALVRGSATSALEVKGGTVAAAGVDPAFVVTFSPRLVIGEAYSVKLWMDFNANGTCDAAPADHQWSVEIPADLSSHQTTFVYGHSTAFSPVCAFFP